MSQTIQQKQIGYFTRYAGSCLKIWNSVVGQHITHSSGWTGTVVGVKKIDIAVLNDLRGFLVFSILLLGFPMLRLF